MKEFGMLFIIFGVIFIAVGLIIILGPQIPFIRKLPGDIYLKNGNFSFYFPLTTCIIISIKVFCFVIFFFFILVYFFPNKFFSVRICYFIYDLHVFRPISSY